MNEIKGHDIDDGGHENLKISDIYGIIKNLEKLNGVYENGDKNPVERYILKFDGNKVNLKKTFSIIFFTNDFLTSSDIYIKKVNENFVILVPIWKK